MKWAAVIGTPIAHSLSPIMHNAAYRQLGINARFEAVEVDQDSLTGFISDLADDLLGLAVTMPLKQRIIPLLDVVEPLAQAVGAVNTVVPSHRVLTGFNTDVYGIVEALREAGEADGRARAVILGSRATASSALAAMGELHVGHTSIIARRFSGPGSISLSEMRLGVSPTHIPWRNTEEAVAALNQADLIVSTLPAGVADHWAPMFKPRAQTLVLDAPYYPWPSQFALAAERAGALAVSGLSMLLHQARRQFELMTGQDAPVDIMRSALEQALTDHA
ncbi:MAG: shikimate dehydrogenase [Actinomycetaceae bacterium]|nr:shikimate dehydrogenase [Actinomycetaceae bacterium]